MAQKMVLEPGSLLLGNLGTLDQDDAVLGQPSAQRAPALLLVTGQCRYRFRDAAKLLRGSKAVRAFGGDTGANLSLEAGNPHHEEFIEVVCGNREELDLLQQRLGIVTGFLEDAAIEMKP